MSEATDAAPQPAAETTAPPATTPTKTLVARPAATPKRTRPAPASGCAAVAGARVLGSEAPYADHPDGLPLTGGTWSRGGEKLAVQRPCTAGRLDGLNGTATLATLMWSAEGTTGRWWALALCAPASAGTRCVVQDVLGDREPIQSVTIAGGDAVVVYLARTEDVPAAGVNLRRTASYHYHVNRLKQTSFGDQPYTP
ncbi:hypothetical protein GCM10020358_18790 [Amorphoplanes nipponensis]|uniref:hypothetical protein n=1 Tax=Actinoplanes nipponensis TaxID=135950 RepID=UPI001944DDEC|nr:hypothetical protein [Actinoplanes nipponensis]